MTTALTRVDPQTGEDLTPQPFNMGDYLRDLSSPRALEDAKKLAAAYDRAVNALIGAGDVQDAGGGKVFKKKSAWRKLARFFNVSTRIVSEETVTDDEGHTVAKVIVEARAPWGQTVEAIGKCSTRETRFRSLNMRQKADHDCPATAATRATNRAISDLIAAGEVSAEEVDGSDTEEQPRRDVFDPATMALEAALAVVVNKQKLGDLSDAMVAKSQEWARTKLQETPDSIPLQRIARACELIRQERDSHEPSAPRDADDQ